MTGDMDSHADEVAFVRRAEWIEDCPGTGTYYFDQSRPARCHACMGEVEVTDVKQAYNGMLQGTPLPHQRREERELVWIDSGCSCGGVFLASDKPPNPYSGEELAAINTAARLDDIEGKLEYLIGAVERLIERLDS